MIRIFLIENENEVQNFINNVEFENNIEFENSLASITKSIFEFENLLASSTKSIRAKRLLLRYQNVANIIVFLQDDQFDFTFIESRRKEINDLLEKRVFELIIIDKVSKNVRIFNSRFVDEIKHSETSQTYEKSRLVIQTYNDQEKNLILTQILIIQRMRQRIIFALASRIEFDHYIYLRNITQIYVQFSISLNRTFFIRSSSKLELSDESIFRVIKSLYEVLEINAH